MANTGRKTMVAAVMAVSLFLADRTFATDQLTIVLHVTDFAHVSRATLSGAKREASRIYQAAGVNLVWVNPGEPPEATTGDALHVNVVLLDQETAEQMIKHDGIADGVLGEAVHDTGRAYIFCYRILATAEHHGSNFGFALGRVLAHETGHLVLPVRGHSATGIMQATLDLSQTRQGFDPDQVAMIDGIATAGLVARR
jgi:hypothetical protein